MRMEIERNYKLDLYKGLAAMGVLWIHIGTFISPANTQLLASERELSSLVVPVLFLISWYFFAKSKTILPGP